jgi:biotin carboxyl carrier protein
MKFQARLKDKLHDIEVRREGNNFEVILDGGSIHVDRIFSDASHDVLLIDNACYDVVIAGEESRYHINVLNRFFDVEIIDPRKRALHHTAIEEGGRKPIRAKMPGRIIKVLVEEGQEVEEGQGLLILEAMKMQNEIKASRAGVIHSIAVKENDPVESGFVMMVLE